MKITTLKKLADSTVLAPTLITLGLTLSLSGCGGGSGSSSTPVDNTPVDDEPIIEDPVTDYYAQDTSAGVEISNGDFDLTRLVSGNTANSDGSGQIRQLTLSWERAFNDTSTITYTLCQFDSEQTGNCAVLGHTTDSLTFTTSVSSVLNVIDARYFVIADNGIAQANSSLKQIHPGQMSNLAGYFKASNTGGGDDFGRNVALSQDGKTMVVNAYFEKSDATGVDGDQGDSTLGGAFGAVYVFRSDDDDNWQQSAYLKAAASDVQDYFGYAIAISADGNTIAIGASHEDSNTTTDQHNNDAENAGATYLFTYDGSNWSQTAYLKDDQIQAGARFGTELALSDEGTRLVIGSPFYAINTDNETLADAGAVALFELSDGEWQKVAQLSAEYPTAKDRLGFSLDISGDGNVIAIASYLEDSVTQGINGDADNDDAEDAGAVYIFTEQDEKWQPTAYIKSSNSQAGDYFGRSLALDEDGDTLVVGAIYEDSSAMGVDGDKDDNSVQGSGAAYLFSYVEGQWQEDHYFKGSNSEHNPSEDAWDKNAESWGDQFGKSVAISDDGNTLVVGSTNEDSSVIGINWDENDNSSEDAGAAYLFIKDPVMGWQQQAYIKSPSAEEDDSFATSISLSADGSALAVGAHKESSGSTGINSPDTNRDDDDQNDENYSGAVYLF